MRSGVPGMARWASKGPGGLARGRALCATSRLEVRCRPIDGSIHQITPPAKEAAHQGLLSTFPLAPSSISIHVLSPLVHPTCPLKVWIYLGVKWHEAIWVQQQLPAYPGGVGSGTPGIAAVRNASGLLLSAAQPCACTQDWG